MAVAPALLVLDKVRQPQRECPRLWISVLWSYWHLWGLWVGLPVSDYSGLEKQRQVQDLDSQMFSGVICIHRGDQGCVCVHSYE